MITGEFLVCDDLGPLSRLVPPGDLFVMEPRDVNLVISERKWIGDRYLKADGKAEGYRKRLRTAHMRGRRDAVREWFDVWTIEAAKYSVCDNWLLSVIGRLETNQPMAMNVPKDFHWTRYGPIRELTGKVVAATDEEILHGARFRA